MPKFVQKIFERYDMSKDRTVESYKYKVTFLWDHRPVEEYLTDDEKSRDQLVEAARVEQYGVRVEEGEFKRE